MNNSFFLNFRPIRITIVDEHKLYKMALEAVFSHYASTISVNSLPSVSDFLDWYNGRNTDIVLLSSHHVMDDCLMASRQILDVYPSSKIIVTEIDSNNRIKGAMHNIGISGYLDKNADIEKLFMTILLVHSGNKGVNLYDEKRIEKNGSIDFDDLTAREFEILLLLAKGLTNIKIAQELNISPLTIKTHRQNLLRKIKAKNVVELIYKAKSFMII